MVVNAIQSGFPWAPNIAHEVLKQKPTGDAFALTSSPPPEKNSGFKFFGADGITPSDAIDIVNPLQHLPIIGPLYREFSGDTLDPFSRIAGNTLFFGPFGAAFSSINIAIEGITGKDMGKNIIAVFKNENINKVGHQVTGTYPVNPTTSTADKNNTIDPVLAWATAEINHRNSEALKKGIDLPTRIYSTLIANNSILSTHPTQTAIASAHPVPIKLKPTHIDQVLSQVQKTTSLADHGLLALNEMKSSLLALPTTLQQIKRTTNAYAPKSRYINQLSFEQPNNHTARNTPHTKTNPAQSLGTISTNGGWFSSFINDSFSKYQTAENSRLLRDKANKSLAPSLR
jgi:hypothetical protein